MRKYAIVATLVLLAPIVATATNLYIPVVGRVAGANGTFFRTDVRIFNPSATRDLPVSLHFLPRGIDGSNIPGTIVNVPKRQMVVLDDIVGNFFHQTSAIGALRLDSDVDRSYSFSADSRTYTDSANGTYGQFIPAFDGDAAVKDNVVLHVSHNSDYRTNVGFMNPGNEPAVMTVSLFRADGTLVTPAIQMTVLPKSMVQDSVPTVFNRSQSVDDGFIVVKSTVGVFAWISVVDNHSGDQIFVPGVEDKDEIKPLPPLP